MSRKETQENDQSYDLLSSVPTVISESFTLRGAVKYVHAIRIDGTIIGDIEQADTVVVTIKGKVQGNINTNHLVVYGCIEGNISAVKSISIKSTGRIIGKLDTDILTIEHGATYEGLVAMEASLPLKK